MAGFSAPINPFATYCMYPEFSMAIMTIVNDLKHRSNNLNLKKHLIFGLCPAAVQCGGWIFDKATGNKINWNKRVGLDECIFEIERFPSYTPDDYFRVVVNGVPLPAPYPTNAVSGGVDSSYAPRWNWSLYLKKQVVRHFGLVGQIGRGHQRWESNPNASGLYDFEAALVKPDHLGWTCSGIFSF